MDQILFQAMSHEPDHSTVFQLDVALEPVPSQLLSWASLAPPEAASFDAWYGVSFVAWLNFGVPFLSGFAASYGTLLHFRSSLFGLDLILGSKVVFPRALS
jgi:hypothetical protein